MKVKNKISSIKFDMLFTWLRQRVVKGLDAAPWWFIYLGCNACLVCFDFKIQKFILDSFFTNQMFIICNGFVSVKYGYIIWNVIWYWVCWCVSKTKLKAFHAWCFFNHTKLFSFFLTKTKISNKYMIPNSMQT